MLKSIFLLLILTVGVVYAVGKSEQNECIKWAKQATEVDYHYLPWQKSQCGIK